MEFWSQLLDDLAIGRHVDPLLILASILLLGAAGGWLARLAHLPSITGQVLAGVLIGPVFHLFEGEETLAGMRPLTTFAMSLIAVGIGGHLSYRRIHNTLGRIVLLAVCEVACAVVLVTLTLQFFTTWPTAILLGALAAATAPAAIMHIIRENRAKGPFVKTILSTVAVDNILAIAFFVLTTTMLALHFAEDGGEGEWRAAVALAAWNLLGAAALGILTGLLAESTIHVPKLHKFSTIFVAVLILAGFSRYLGVSPLLASLVFGIYLANRSRATEEQLDALEPITPVLFVIFFTVAGMTLHLEALASVGLLSALYLVARMAGKMLGATLGGILSRGPRRIWGSVALGLTPHASLAIALTVLLQTNPALPESLRTTVPTLVLAAVVVNDTIGPLLTLFALRLTGEQQKDRRRLIEFIEEEFIKTDLKAESKEDAIRQLCEFLIRSHRIDVKMEDLFRTVMDREAEDATALGEETAMPHGRIESGPAILGVLGLCPEGVDWGAPDGKPVKIVMLIVTPENHQAQHLQVLSALAAMVSNDLMRSKLLNAETPNDVWEIIEGRETPDYNYFLEG